MKRTIALLAAAPCAAFCSAVGAHAEGAWYVSGSVGGYFREDDTQNVTFFQVNDPQVRASGNIKHAYDPGVMGALALGYRLSPRLRAEIEISYSGYSGDTLNPFTTSPAFPNDDGRTFHRQSGANYSRVTGTVNAFYDFAPIAFRFSPYVGAGFGGSSDRKSAGRFVGPFGGTLDGASSSDATVVALAEGGLNIALSDHWSVAPAYRYVHYFDGESEGAHIVKASVRYTF
jgi:opacity protein-like surface antigen